MNSKLKNIVYSLFLIVIIGVVWFLRKSNNDLEEFSGDTMGTTYQVKYHGDKTNYQHEVDSILIDVNNSLSTYIQDSEISMFNEGGLIKIESPYFYPVLKKSKEIFEETKGAFDPTVMPLVRAWGFGPGEEEFPDSMAIEGMLDLVGFDSIFFNEEALCKMKKEMQLDFSALAKGYGVDIVFEYLATRGLKDIYVEIGGELRTSGVNEKGEKWRIGIEDPASEINQRELFNILEISGRSMATSGNYRNFYIKDGIKYAHTISPFTGYPVEHSLLSATVISDDCITADAYATAFMVMGLEKAKVILEEHPELDAYLIYGEGNGVVKSFKTSGIKLLRDDA